MQGRTAWLPLLIGITSCSRPYLPPLDARARVVPVAPERPSSCDLPGGEREAPREMTAMESRMRSYLVLPNHQRDVEACRALCRRALGPGEDVVSCFRAQTRVPIGCAGEACSGRRMDAIRQSLFCGAAGQRAAADPVAAQAALPFVVPEHEDVIVCSLQ